MRNTFYALVVTSTLFCSPSLRASTDEPGIVEFRSLSLKTARIAAWGAIESCREKGYSVAVAIVDRGGNIQALYRDRLAGPHTSETAVRKAWTANSFRQNTGDLAVMLQKGQIPNQVQHNPGALLVGGGVMITSNGQLIGGIGVSGAPPGKSEAESIDGACARVGLERIQDTLDFGE